MNGHEHAVHRYTRPTSQHSACLHMCMQVSKSRLLISAPTQVGALHALETLSQMLTPALRSSASSSSSSKMSRRLQRKQLQGSALTAKAVDRRMWLVAETNITDYPRFKHRCAGTPAPAA